MECNENLLLLPQPRQIKMNSGNLCLKNNSRIICRGDASVLFSSALRVKQMVREWQHKQWHVWAGDHKDDLQCQAVLSVMPSSEIPPQGYRLQIDANKIEICGRDTAGVFYAVMTLDQIMRLYQGTLPACEIVDYPDFASRGVMLDISRDKVPTMETLFALVDRLSFWKINHLELYTEHTFAYRKHPEVWAQASPMTGEEILLLDAYCRERFVELVPNQNSFGHLQRWLGLPSYNALAECPQGFTDPWGKYRTAFSLCPVNPNALEFLDELYGDLLPHFTSHKFNVGCDETFDLGLGKSAERCKSSGKGEVYLKFLIDIYELVRRHGRTMHFWGDIILKHPELISRLPRDIVGLLWGYEENHPFEEQCSQFAASGIPFYVCPGTSTWLSIAGRTQNCIRNLNKAVSDGLAHGASGLLNTDWGDCGHWQYLPISYLGFAAGAALGWCYSSNRETDWPRALDIHVFHDNSRIMGKLAYDLGNSYLNVPQIANSSMLFQFLFREDIPVAQLQQINFQDAQDYVQDVLAPLDRAIMTLPDAGLIHDEFANAGQMLLHSIRRCLLLSKHSQDLSLARSLASHLRSIIGEHRRLWMARNRTGGLQDSTRVLEKLLSTYENIEKHRDGVF